MNRVPVDASINARPEGEEEESLSDSRRQSFLPDAHAGMSSI